jgi:hypothetical protein
MKSSYVFGVLVALLVGTMGGWGIYAYLSLKAQLETAQKELQTAPSSPMVAQAPMSAGTPTSTVPATPQPSPTPAIEVKFEDLPLCDQLDSIAKAKKSVAQFIVDSGRYDEFATQVKTKCTWNAEQLQQANAILYPPVQIVEREASSGWQSAEVNQHSTGRASVPQPKRRAWNNCNGIQEPGESYSAECHAIQRRSDRLGRGLSGDRRPPSVRNGSSDGGNYY